MSERIPDLVAYSSAELHCSACRHHMRRKVNWNGHCISGVFVKCTNKDCFHFDKVFEASVQVPLYVSGVKWENL